MPARHKGNVSIRQTYREKVWDETLGWTTVIRYHGKWSDIDAAAENATYVNGAARVRAVQNGDQAQDGTLEITFPAKSQADAISTVTSVPEFSNTWTLVPAEEEIEVERHSAFRGLSRIASEEGYVQRILLAIEQYKSKVSTGISAGDSNKDLAFSLGSYITKKGTAGQWALADELAAILLEGQETEPVDRYALRNVRVVPGNTNITASHANTREMWSNNKMIQLIQSSSASITQRALIGDIAATFSGSYWYKLAPTIDEMTNGRYQIVTEWINYAADEFNETLRPKYE
jgi:hypothetical protein